MLFAECRYAGSAASASRRLSYQSTGWTIPWDKNSAHKGRVGEHSHRYDTTIFSNRALWVADVSHDSTSDHTTRHHCTSLHFTARLGTVTSAAVLVFRSFASVRHGAARCNWLGANTADNSRLIGLNSRRQTWQQRTCHTELLTFSSTGSQASSRLLKAIQDQLGSVT